MTNQPFDHSRSYPSGVGTIAYPWGPVLTDQAGTVHHHDMVYVARMGYRPLTLDLAIPRHVPGVRLPVIVHVHGGGWVWGWNKRVSVNFNDEHIFEQFAAAGFAVARIDYQKAWEANAETMALQVRAAIRWLRHYAADFDLDPGRIATFGESAGGHLVLLAAYSTRLDGLEKLGDFGDEDESVQAIVDWYGVSDIDALAATETADPEYPESPFPKLIESTGVGYREISPLYLVRPGLPATCLIHGDADTDVPVDQSRRLFAALQAAGVDSEYLEVPEVGHVFTGCDHVQELVGHTIAFLRSRLG